MPRLLSLLALAALLLPGCAVIWPVAEVVTYPLDKKGTFEEAQKRYTANIRYGLYEEAVAFVEPELQARFKEELPRFKELRFSDFRIGEIELDAARTKATAVVTFRGYTLAAPFEREFVVRQQWRRKVPTQDWYVTPDFDALLPDAG